MTAYELGRHYALAKLAVAPLTLTHHVSEDALASVAKYGLLSSAALAKNRAALNLARPDKDERRAWLARLKQELDDRPHRRGISAMIKDAPETTMLAGNHPIVTNKLTPITIDIAKLMRDMPDTKLYGMELTPFAKSRVGKLTDDEYAALTPAEKDKLMVERHRFVAYDELRRLGRRSPESLWQHYRATPEPMYAPDVPHVAVIPRLGVIPAKYLHGLPQA